MKKVLCFAAAALTLFAACQKTTVVYDNSEPQEIAVFAVNKAATKAPVADAVFPDDYDMQVAAYLAAGGLTEDANSGDYFDGTLFSKGDGTVWTGGKYWPMSTATLNFLAVAVPPASSSYTGTAEVVFGEVEEATKSNFVKKAVVTFANNQTVEAVAEGTDESDAPTPAVEANYNQFDLMYAAGSQSHEEGGTYDNVAMTFKHALSWIKFTVETNLNNTTEDGPFSMKVNSIRLSGASYGGTLTISKSDELTDEDFNTDAYEPVWSQLSDPLNDVYVPGTPTEDAVSIASPSVNLSAYDVTTPQAFGNGLLVVPCNYNDAADDDLPKITINYTMNQGYGEYTFERTVTIPAIEWECNKIYTYALNITLTEISVAPIVDEWTSHDNDGNNGNNNDIPVDMDPEP